MHFTGSAAYLPPVPSKMADRVLLEVINTKHKKTGGTLRLMSNNLIWVPYGADNPKLSCAYSEIKGNISERNDLSFRVTCTSLVCLSNFQCKLVV